VTAGPDRRPAAVVVEADGGSRGNPGKAAYGALLKDAATGRVLAERAERIGVASNNVAEYRGLIAGLELYREHAEGAELEVRMDSKLVVEQMAGRWKIKHPSMRPLALEANRLAPPDTRWTWVPREENKHADRLANLALDGPEGVVHGGPVLPDEPVDEQREASPGTTVVLVTEGSAEEVAATAEWLAAGLAGTPADLLSTSDPGVVAAAELLGRRLGTTPSVEAGLGRHPARLRERLVGSPRVVVAVTGREQVATLTSFTLGLPSRTPLRADLAPASVTVLVWWGDAGVVRLLGGLPRLDLPVDVLVG
jgi:ribonuclease H / adenosylcobalamin/alpha-ribazole phosphatase